MSEQNLKPLYCPTVGEYIEVNKKVFSEQAEKRLQERPKELSEKMLSDIIFMDDLTRLTGYKKATVYSKVCRFENPVLSRRKPLTFSRQAIIDQKTDHYFNSKR